MNLTNAVVSSHKCENNKSKGRRKRAPANKSERKAGTNKKKQTKANKRKRESLSRARPEGRKETLPKGQHFKINLGSSTSTVVVVVLGVVVCGSRPGGRVCASREAAQKGRTGDHRARKSQRPSPAQRRQADKGSYRAKSEKRPQGKRKKREGHAREEEDEHKNLRPHRYMCLTRMAGTPN